MNDYWDGHYYKHHSDFQQSNALAMLKSFPLKGDEHVLDVGCGPGTISQWIAERTKHVIGLDPSKDMIKQALQDYSQTPRLTFVCEKLETFQTHQKFDLITSFHALHFVENHRDVFAKMLSWLSPQGHLLIAMASELQPMLADLISEKKWSSTVDIYKKFFPLSLDKASILLHKLGFKINKLAIKPIPYIFTSSQHLRDWLLGWIKHPSGLDGKLLDEFATDFTTRVCRQIGSSSAIPITLHSLTIDATPLSTART